MTRDKEIRQAGLTEGEKYWLAGSPGIEKKLIKRTPLEMFICGANWADAYPVNPWHKASEELPKEEKNYLICYGWNPEVSIHTIARWNKRKKAFIDWSEYYDSEVKVKEVRYWMEIPEIKED